MMEWIENKKTFPLEADIYLALFEGEGFEILYFDGEDWQTDSPDEITHWMPLPELPNGMD